jgi:hypothetical protein
MGGRWLAPRSRRTQGRAPRWSSCEDDRLDVLGPLAQVGEVRQDQVDAHHLRGGEAQADVHHHDAAVELDDRHVLAYLTEPAEGQYTQR